MSRRVCSNACVSRAHIKTIHSPKDDTPPLGKEDAVRAEVQREKRRRFRGQTSSPKKERTVDDTFVTKLITT